MFKPPSGFDGYALRRNPAALTGTPSLPSRGCWRIPISPHPRFPFVLESCFFINELAGIPDFGIQDT